MALHRKYLRKYSLGSMIGSAGSVASEEKEKDPSTKGNFGSAMGVAGTLGTTLIDSIDTGNRYGRQSTGSTMAKGALSGAAAGAAAGPIGAGVGAVVGLIGGFLGGNKAKKEEEKYKKDIAEMDVLKGSTYASTPAMYQGNTNASYFKTGGQLSSNYLAMKQAHGGTMATPSSDGIDFQGRSHEAGGIQIPSMGAEVEGGETAKGSYVFSEELGFAKAHRPIMKAKGMVEKKPATRERINTIKLLDAREEKLKLSQEYFKQIHGLK